ncbi:MAG: RHS repeat-associated core domain-containing protein, partial [Deltaproteobacteria bacterium]|nr:RHS repeat-associated core domain-containing protein [Deltaproteobacteria bacterium]
GTASSTLVRNAPGHITNRTDFRGVQTTWANHDVDGSPGTVTEAVGEPEQRTTTFTYHPELHTALSIVRPSALPGGTQKVAIFDYQKPASGPPPDPPLNPPADLDPATFNIPGTNNTNFDRVVHRVIESGWTRDAAGTPLRVAYVSHFSYDGFGRVTSIDGPRDNTGPAGPDVTTFAYYADNAAQGNKRGQLQTVTNAASQVTAFNDYDAMGNALSVTDPNGLTTTFTYDAGNRVRTITQVGAGVDGGGQPIDLVTTYVYEANGNLDYIALPRGNFINYQFDGADRLSSITRTATEPTSPSDTPAGETIRYSYDSEGNRTREEVAPGVSAQEVRFTDFEYDALNRLEKVYNPVFTSDPVTDAVFRRSTYDANGNRKALDLEQVQGMTSTTLRHTAFAFDPLNRLKDVTQDDGSPSGVLTAYAYDVQDNLRTLTDGNNHDTDYGTDDFGRQVEAVSPDTGTARFEYDEAGNLVEKDQNGLVTEYTYDALNRLALVHFPSDSSEDLAYTYDTHADAPPKENGVGRLVRIEDASGKTYFSYDKRGNVALEERQQGGVTLTTSYAWDPNGNLQSLTYPSGRKLTYSYALANDQPQTVAMNHQGQNRTLAFGIAFEAFGPLASLQYGNGLVETRTYDVAGQLDGLSVAPNTGPAVLSLDYTFDETGNISGIVDTQGSEKNKSYIYDRLDRLDTATVGDLGDFDYDYDPVGNRTREDHDGAVTTYTIEATNNQIDTLSGATTATFGYDTHGNTTTDGTLTFAYHPTHQLKQVQEPGMAVLGTYQYDGQSRRTAKTVQGLTRLFAYDTGAQMLGEYDAAGNVLKEYAYLGTQRLVMVDHDRDDEGIRDEVDNCSVVQNPDQADGDSDLLGDLCDAAPGNPDRDGDGLLDGEEDADKDGQVSAGETDPDNPDTDGDTFSDGVEVAAGTDPLDPNSYPGAPSAIPALSVMGVVIFLVLFAAGRFWALRRRWSKVGRGMDLMVLALGLTLMAPEGVTPQGGGTPERVYYIHTDHLGTALKLTDANQQVAWDARAEAFGKTTVTATNTVFNLRFPGQYYDAETGLTHNGFRTYSSQLGAYLQADPIGDALTAATGVTGLHYGYADASPTGVIDPLGLDGIAQGAYDYWEAVGVAGASQGGVRGTAQMAAAAFAQASIDFFLARWIESEAGLAGYAYGQQCYGEALKHGGYAAGGIALSSGAIGYVVPKIPGLFSRAARVGSRVDPTRLSHIFRDAPGHVNPSTVASRERFLRLFEDVASNPLNRRPDFPLPKEAVEAGVESFTKTYRSGKQIWVLTRDGKIINAGVNPGGAIR